MTESTSSEASATDSRKRRLLPRFGLRALLVFSLLFSLAFGWVGKNLYQVRQEEAAIETLKRAGASIHVKTKRGFENHPATPYMGDHSANPNDLPSLPARLLGIGGPSPVVSVDLTGEDPADAAQREALAALETFPHLETVWLRGTAFDDESMKSLASLPKLNGMLVARTSVTGEGWKRFADRSTLRHVTLFGEDSGGLVEGLPALKSLRWLQLADRGLSRNDVEVLASLPELTSLVLTAVSLEDDDAFVPLSEAQSIRELRLSVHPNSRPLTEADVAAIVRLPHVASLSIEGLDIPLLASLESIETLRIVSLYEPVTAQAAQEFSARNPDCLVPFVTDDVVVFLDGERIKLDAARTYAAEVQEGWTADGE